MMIVLTACYSKSTNNNTVSYFPNAFLLCFPPAPNLFTSSPCLFLCPCFLLIFRQPAPTLSSSLFCLLFFPSRTLYLLHDSPPLIALLYDSVCFSCLLVSLLLISSEEPRFIFTPCRSKRSSRPGKHVIMCSALSVGLEHPLGMFLR